MTIEEKANEIEIEHKTFLRKHFKQIDSSVLEIVNGLRKIDWGHLPSYIDIVKKYYRNLNPKSEFVFNVYVEKAFFTDDEFYKELVNLYYDDLPDDEVLIDYRKRFESELKKLGITLTSKRTRMPDRPPFSTLLYGRVLNVVCVEFSISKIGLRNASPQSDKLIIDHTKSD